MDREQKRWSNRPDLDCERADLRPNATLTLQKKSGEQSRNRVSEKTHGVHLNAILHDRFFAISNDVVTGFRMFLSIRRSLAFGIVSPNTNDSVVFLSSCKRRLITLAMCLRLVQKTLSGITFDDSRGTCHTPSNRLRHAGEHKGIERVCSHGQPLDLVAERVNTAWALAKA